MFNLTDEEYEALKPTDEELAAMMPTEAQLDEWIAKYSPTDLGKKLISLLKKIRNNKEFILSCLMDCKTEEQKQKLITLIEEYGLDNNDDVMFACMYIEEGKPVEFEDGTVF